MCSIIFFAAKEQTSPLNILVTPYTIQSLEKRTIIKKWWLAPLSVSARCCYSYCSINKLRKAAAAATALQLQLRYPFFFLFVKCCGTPFRQLLFNQQRKPAAAAVLWLQE